MLTCVRLMIVQDMENVFKKQVDVNVMMDGWVLSVTRLINVTE